MIVKPSRSNIKKAASILRKGGIIALPSETFYALCVNARDSAAVEKIIRIKGRDAHKGIPVFFKSRRQLLKYVRKPENLTLSLMDAFWPGPLSLIFYNKSLPRLLEGGKKSILGRISPQKVLTELLAELSCPLTATSANFSGARNPRSAKCVEETLGPHIDLIIEGGYLSATKPSTIVDARKEKITILRKGKISPAQLNKYQ